MKRSRFTTLLLFGLLASLSYSMRGASGVCWPDTYHDRNGVQIDCVKPLNECFVTFSVNIDPYGLPNCTGCSQVFSGTANVHTPGGTATLPVLVEVMAKCGEILGKKWTCPCDGKEYFGFFTVCEDCDS